MTAEAKQGFLKGAAILTAATMLVKVIGLLYKIPLANMLGGTGMGYFFTAYSIFTPLYALSVAGFPSAVSKMVSESVALGRYREARRIFRVSLSLFLVIGVLASAALFAGSGVISRLVGNPGAVLAVRAMAPSLMLCSVMAAFRGYYQGLGNMTPTAVSQVVESVAKLGCGLGLGWYFLQRGLSEYAAAGTVYGQAASGAAQAQLLAMPYAAAGAVLGVTLSTAAGAAYLLLRRLLGGDGIAAEHVRQSPQARGRGELRKALLAFALPVCMAAAVANFTTLIDLVTIMNRLGTAMTRDAGPVLSMYSGLIPDGLAQSEIPAYLYGAYGNTTSFLHLVPAITTALGISALPVIASAWARGQRKNIAFQAKAMVKMAALVSLPAGLGMSMLARPVMDLFYPLSPQEAALAAPVLEVMGLAAVFVGISAPLNSLYQAIGRADIPVKLMAAGALVKIAINYVFVAMPQYNIKAAPWGTLACYALILTAGLVWLKWRQRISVSPVQTLFKPLICAAVCAVAAKTSFELLSGVVSMRLATVLAVAVGGCFYAIFVLFLKIITKNEALMLPNGKKIAKILEKRALLG